MTLFAYKMPELGEGLHEGEIVKWLAKPGEAIKEDDILMEVQNDKAVVEVPSPVTGIIKELKVEEGQTAVVGDVLALIETDSEVPGVEVGGGGDSTAAGADQQEPADPSRARNDEAVEGAGIALNGLVEKPGMERKTETGAGQTDMPKAQPAEPANGLGASPQAPSMVLATPAVRKLARELQVPIEQVKGSGKHGRITREDVEAFAAQGGAAADPSTKTVPKAEEKDLHVAEAPPAIAETDLQQLEKRVPFKGIRKAIAAAMTRSVYTAPHVTIMDEAHVAKLVELRSRFKPEAEAKGIKLTYLPFIVKALLAAVRQFPALNASIDDERGEIVYKSYYHIGIATDTEQGLLVPVIRDADRKNIWAIAAEIQDLANRAREGKLAPAEMKGSTVSITNIGSAGGMFFTPVINWPEVAILGIGRISEKPAVVDGQLTVGQMMAISLSFDHRLVDGAAAQQAVNLIKRLLEEPELLVMEV